MLNLLEGIVGEYLYDLWVGMDFEIRHKMSKPLKKKNGNIWLYYN